MTRLRGTARRPGLAGEDVVPTAGDVLAIRDLSLSYGPRLILDAVSVSVSRREAIAVIGKSGCGKSSLLSCVLGLLRPDSGEILVDGHVVKAGSSKPMTLLRRTHIGMVFQSGQLLPELTPRENVVIAGVLAGLTARQARERCEQLMTELQIDTEASTTWEMSGGERQRLALARALMNRPAVLLADEPTGSLDPETRDQVTDVLFSVPSAFDCALVTVTHDPVVAGGAARTYALEAGKLVPQPRASFPEAADARAASADAGTAR